MAKDFGEVLKRLEKVEQNKKYQIETEEKNVLAEKQKKLDDAYERLSDLVDFDDRLFQLMKIYWFLDENGSTFESGTPEMKRYFTYIQDNNLPSHEGDIYFHPRQTKQGKANIKISDNCVLYYKDEKGTRFSTNDADLVMQFDYNEYGDWKVRFNAWYKGVDDNFEKWHDFSTDKEENPIEEKTNLINKFCDRLPEFMEECENVFEDYLKDQELKYGDEDIIRTYRINDFVHAYNQYLVTIQDDGQYCFPIDADELKDTYIVQLNDASVGEDYYVAFYDTKNEKYLYWKGEYQIKEEPCAIDKVTDELVKGWEPSYETHFKKMLQILQQTEQQNNGYEVFFTTENDEFLWNNEHEKLFKCNAVLNEHEKSLLLKNAEENDYYIYYNHKNSMVSIVFDNDKDDEECLFDIVKKYGDNAENQSKEYQELNEQLKLKQGRKM